MLITDYIISDPNFKTKTSVRINVFEDKIDVLLFDALWLMSVW